MAKKRLSDYTSYMAAAMRSISPKTAAEARSAMKRLAAEWRRVRNPEANPTIHHKSSRRGTARAPRRKPRAPRVR